MSAVKLRHGKFLWFHAYHADFLPLPTDAETVSHPIFKHMQNSNGLARGLSDLSVPWFEHSFTDVQWRCFFCGSFLLFMFCVFHAVLSVHCSLVHSSFAIILMGKRELVALLSLSSWCLMIALRLFLAVSSVCLQFVIVLFHTHLLFLRPPAGKGLASWLSCM